jgi:hypothetical protein
MLVIDSSVQQIHYDMEDMLEQANEIQESLGRSYAVPDEIDEADLEAGMFLRISSYDKEHLFPPQNLMPSRWRRRKKAHHILLI